METVPIIPLKNKYFLFSLLPKKESFLLSIIIEIIIVATAFEMKVFWYGLHSSANFAKRFIVAKDKEASII